MYVLGGGEGVGISGVGAEDYVGLITMFIMSMELTFCCVLIVFFLNNFKAIHIHKPICLQLRLV